MSPSGLVFAIVIPKETAMKMSMILFAVGVLVLAGCDEETSPGGDSSPPVVDGGQGDRGTTPGNEGGLKDGPSPGDGPLKDDAMSQDATKADLGGACKLGATQCLSQTQHRICKQVGGKTSWVTEACASGTRCLDSRCSAGCADQCTLGYTRTSGGKQQTCALLSVASNKYVSLSAGMHDRARKYHAWTRKHHLPNGTMSDTRFATTALKKPVSYHGTGDSAIWTGSYLAAEALRLKVTGAPDARASVRRLVEAIHRLFEITKHKGFMARYAAPTAGPDPVINKLYNASDPRHHKTKFKGQDYYWSGNTSRDQYQGVLMGYSLAYDVLTSAAHKKMIRDDMVALVQELIKQRKVKITVRFHAGKWQEMSIPVTMQYVVLNPTEFKKGGPYIQIGTTAKPNAYEDSTMQGFQEFMPDYAKLLKQIPILGLLIVFPVPRSGSAIMLANILNIGMQVTKGVPGQAANHAAFKSHYDKQRAYILGIMKLYTNLNDANTCWKSYYGLNISQEPVYNLLRLEQHAATRASMVKDVLQARMWPVVKDHKNSFFSYIYASQGPKGGATAAAAVAATAQLKQFPPPPKALKTKDLASKYTANPKCSNQSKTAVDVKDRIFDDFIWQRHPFELKKQGDGKTVYPGADYLLAYWMGRRHGFLNDDAKGTCLRWK